ncbi:hypothetical protein [Azospirillum thermophilum]|uniref:hypothetical protein n=1 Tax=Azospirillum thermophilum TaxID=2202148 RepID=UPI001FE37954|nr:hypothetical protein [Azospirillum thermophilum]
MFTDQEVVHAVIDRRRRMREKLPQGTVGKVTYQIDGGVRTTIQVTNDDGTDESMALGEAEVAAALVSYCMNRKIPLPVDSDKQLHVINENLTLLITMNFNKAPRLVVDHEHGDGTADPDPSPAPQRRRAGR